ncbi:MAG: hypothetical protein QM770_23195 [Tepidisphaeraceae bacterium]
MSEFEQSYNAALEGLIASARSEKAKDHALQTLEQLAGDMMADPAAGMAGAPSARLSQTVLALRRLAFSLHRPDVADRVDRAMLAAFPTDRGLAEAALAERQAWGLAKRANAFGTTTAPATTSAAELQRRLLLGDVDAIRSSLKELQSGASATLDDETWQAVLTVALAIGDQQTFDALVDQRWPAVVSAMQSATAPIESSETKANPVAAYIANAWPGLSEAGRRQLVRRVDGLADRAPEAMRPDLAFTALRLSAASGEALANPQGRRAEVVKGSRWTGPQFAEFMTLTPEVERVDVLKQVLDATSPEARRALLLQWLGTTLQPLDGALLDSFMTSLAATPTPTRNARAEASRGLAEAARRPEWAMNPAQAAAGPRVAEFLLSEAPSDPSVQIVAANAFATSGRFGDADQLALRVVQAIVRKPRLTPADVGLLRDAVQALSIQEAERQVNSAPSTQTSQPATAPSAGLGPQMLRAALLERVGRNDEAFEAMAELFRAAPQDAEVRRWLIEVSDGVTRADALAELMLPFVWDESVIKPIDRNRLTTALMATRRFEDVRRVMSGNPGVSDAMYQIQTFTLQGDTARAMELARRLLATNRRERRYFTPFAPWTATSGGLPDLARAYASAAGVARRPSALQLLAAHPAAMADFLALLDATPPAGRDAAGLIEATVSAALAEPARTQTLLRLLIDRHEADALTVHDRRLLVRIASTGEVKIPEGLAREMDAVATEILATGSSFDRANLAAAYRNAGQTDRAAAVSRWVLASAALDSGRPGLGADEFAPLLNDLPASERTTFIAALAPVPGQTFDDRSEAIRLALLEAQSTDRMDATVESLRSRGLVSSRGSGRVRCALSRKLVRGQDYASFTALAMTLAQDRGDSLVDTLQDLRLWLPAMQSLADDAQRAAAWRAALAWIDGEAATARLTPADRAKLRCTLIAWAGEKAVPAAEAIAQLDVANAVAKHDASVRLWVADAARAIGRVDRAIDAEMQSARTHTLPRMRVARLHQEAAAVLNPDQRQSIEKELKELGYATEPNRPSTR